MELLPSSVTLPREEVVPNLHKIGPVVLVLITTPGKLGIANDIDPIAYGACEKL